MEIWLTVFTGIVAVTLVLQSIAFIALYRSLRALSPRVDAISKDLMRQISGVTVDVGHAVATIKSVAEGVHALREKLSATTEVIQKRVGDIDSFLGEITDAARLEVARIQDAVDTASRRVEDTFELLNRGVLMPVREFTAIIRGVRATVDFLLRRPKAPSGTSSQDEEMFIG